MVFVIGHYLGEGHWEQIGRSSGPDALTAFRRWIELMRVDPGKYGVKGIRGSGWIPLVVDADGVRQVARFDEGPRRMKRTGSMLLALAMVASQATGPYAA
jgi:hypothetical protein